MSVKFSFQSLGQPFERDWPVKVMEPKDGGGFEEQVFMARFRYLEKADLDASIEAKEDGPTFCRRWFVGLGAGEGELTPALFAQMWGRGYVRDALNAAWQEFQRGGPAKN